MAKKKEKNQEEDTDTSPDQSTNIRSNNTDTDNSTDQSVNDSVISKSTIIQNVDKSTHFHYNQVPSFECDECDEKFFSQISLDDHFKVRHEKIDEDEDFDEEEDEDFDEEEDEDFDEEDTDYSSLILSEDEIFKERVLATGFPYCCKCDGKDYVDFLEGLDGISELKRLFLACYRCKHLINEDGECIDIDCRTCHSEDYLEDPEEDYTEPIRKAPQGVLFSLAFGLLFAVIYVFFFGEVYNLFTSQIFFWTYWAGITFPCITGIGILFIFASIRNKDSDDLTASILFVIAAPFLISLFSIVGHLYGTFWLILAVLAVFIFIYEGLHDDDRGVLFLYSILLIGIALFFIEFEEAFKGFALYYVNTLDSLVPTVIKYELVYFLMSISLGFGLSWLFGYLSEGTHHLEIVEHYLVQGTITGFLFFLTEFFIYPISDNILVAIIFAIVLTFISFKGTKMFFDID